jgi:hypothetical protein
VISNKAFGLLEDFEDAARDHTRTVIRTSNVSAVARDTRRAASAERLRCWVLLAKYIEELEAKCKS